VVPVPDRPYFFPPTLLFFQRDWPCDPIFSRWLRAAHTACQNCVCCHTNYWTKLPKFVHRKYASLVNINVGTLLQIAQQKTAKTMKKIFKKKLIPDLPTLIFSRYETGTTGIFFYAWSDMSHKVAAIGALRKPLTRSGLAVSFAIRLCSRVQVRMISWLIPYKQAAPNYYAAYTKSIKTYWFLKFIQRIPRTPQVFHITILSSLGQLRHKPRASNPTFMMHN
jgi:hypothetical protein